MPDAFGYCTNVHPGATIEDLRTSLGNFAVSVRTHLGTDMPLRIGLWLSARTATQLRDPDACRRFADFLQQRRLLPYTLNGFPYGDFHGEVVKHAVYEPNWLHQDRLEYTLTLVEILDQVLQPSTYGSISTLPIAWGIPQLTEQQSQLAAQSLACVVRRLDELEQTSGRRICLCLEPEPGCALQYAMDVVRFFERFLDRADRSDRVRRYVGVCHDICHANVMFEPQADVLHRYRQAGIHIGKVQVSSSVQAHFHRTDPPQLRQRRWESLQQFTEDRYLHQTCVRGPDQRITAFADLPLAIRVAGTQGLLVDSEWRVHFHVPIYAAKLGLLDTGQSDIFRCLELLPPSEETHLEVETYAWNVLPAELRQADISAGIAGEMQWLEQVMNDPAARPGN